MRHDLPSPNGNAIRLCRQDLEQQAIVAAQALRARGETVSRTRLADELGVPESRLKHTYTLIGKQIGTDHPEHDPTQLGRGERRTYRAWYQARTQSPTLGGEPSIRLVARLAGLSVSTCGGYLDLLRDCGLLPPGPRREDQPCACPDDPDAAEIEARTTAIRAEKIGRGEQPVGGDDWAAPIVTDPGLDRRRRA